MSPGECDTGDQTHAGRSGWRLGCLCANTRGHTLPASLSETHTLTCVVKETQGPVQDSFQLVVQLDLKVFVCICRRQTFSRCIPVSERDRDGKRDELI